MPKPKVEMFATARLEGGEVRVALHASVPYGAHHRTTTVHYDVPEKDEHARAVGAALKALLQANRGRMERRADLDATRAFLRAVDDPDDPETLDEDDDAADEADEADAPEEV
jgi:hypothetical protein